MNTFTNRLKELLEEKKKANSRYSLRALARDLDIDQSNLSKILNGKRKPSPQQMMKLEKAIYPLNSLIVPNSLVS